MRCVWCVLVTIWLTIGLTAWAIACSSNYDTTAAIRAKINHEDVR